MRTVRARCGDIVPEAYGVFGFADWDGGYLVQAWCGTALEDFDSLSGSDKEKLMSMFKTLHRQGIEHGDVEPRNVVRDPSSGKLTIIDLAMANVQHRCSDSCEELESLASRL
ncbi:hypothetical protein EXIGLDRAFT_734341 [Exidia glandulosa HHB12029]|uniref:Protein kinase domain-containing protein n=1 Tax=Exidia glandulosa HHB12029 TaxID=1314781 RepID=A0A165K633_EXIGL|nr:hypothetical protein EXIGLDRAFT_734341 [Exidia glandulosa HHB12029]